MLPIIGFVTFALISRQVNINCMIKHLLMYFSANADVFHLTLDEPLDASIFQPLGASKAHRLSVTPEDIISAEELSLPIINAKTLMTLSLIQMYNYISH